jgi:NADPH:quinone reductase-like Zn-dependent oxidoreductase|tara:strand:- start:99903 stop:100979 length:1077 start_codon:yes stop_codon:yes gene_type:complete
VNKAEGSSFNRKPAKKYFPLRTRWHEKSLGVLNLTNSLTYRAYGSPADVLHLEENALPAIGATEVKLRMLAAPINPSDYGMILGKYGENKALPAIGGREGVGEVIEVGDEVSTLTVGSRVIFPGEAGTWQTAAVVPAAGLRQVPADLSIEFAATTMVNPPTAWRILRDANLPKGSWVIQNAANSAVGLNVVQMARHLELRTLNVVRNEKWIGPLKELGGDVVVTEESGFVKDLSSLLGNERPILAINSIGGESALRQLKSLGAGGTQVTIGAMTFDAIRFPTRQLIFNDITLKGFWMDRWYRDNLDTRVQIMFDSLFNLAKEGIIDTHVAAKYPLSDYKIALEENDETRLGKVLFVGS